MPYNHHLANRLRERLQYLPNIEEKEMMGGLVFMMNDKMCVGIIKDELMCHIDPQRHETGIRKKQERGSSARLPSVCLIRREGIKRIKTD